MNITKRKVKKDNPLLFLSYPRFSVKAKVIEHGAAVPHKKIITVRFIFSSDEKKTDAKSKKEGLSPLLKDYPFFKGKPKEFLQTPHNWFYGVGSLDKINTESFSDFVRDILAKSVSSLETLVFDIPPEVVSLFELPHLANIFATSLGVSLYSVDFLKKEPAQKNFKLKQVYIAMLKKYHSGFREHFKKYSILVRHMNAMRQTQALPGNYFTPETAEARAKDIAKKFKLKVRSLGKKQLKTLGAGGILAVSEGSAREPRLITLEYKPSAAKKKLPRLAFVGKGVTFDTGGISLKPGSDMHEMKYDMSGSAAALHAMAAIAELKLPVHAVAVVGMVENMPGAAAFKPGDVYTALNGLTIEVQNTDAEGRLVLGDLLHYAEKNYKPDLVIDLATLTGACMVALGQYYAGCFSNQEKVISLLRQASEDSLEPIWPLPLTKRFTDLLKSNIADHNNIGGRYGGASVAASFLSLFVNEKTNWAHLDIAGIGILKSAFQLYPSPASGYGVRLLAEVAEKLSKEPKLI